MTNYNPYNTIIISIVLGLGMYCIIVLCFRLWGCVLGHVNKRRVNTCWCSVSSPSTPPAPVHHINVKRHSPLPYKVINPHSETPLIDNCIASRRFNQPIIAVYHFNAIVIHTVYIILTLHVSTIHDA